MAQTIITGVFQGKKKLGFCTNLRTGKKTAQFSKGQSNQYRGDKIISQVPKINLSQQ